MQPQTTSENIQSLTQDCDLNILNLAAKEHIDTLEGLAAYILSELNSNGYLLLRNALLDLADIPAASDYFLRLATLIGQPISHDENNKIVWDIKKVHQSSSVVQTYSEHSDEAQLHTDSQYRTDPEDFFGLLCLVPASCGGGVSLLMTLDDLYKEIVARDDAQELMQTLNNEDYPFVVPTVFNRNGSQEREYVFAPILQGNSIRFRLDTIEKALPIHRQRLSDNAFSAFRILKSIILNSPRIRRFHLQAGDMFFINNKTALHGRTAFTDENRHLMRIRMKRRG